MKNHIKNISNICEQIMKNQGKSSNNQEQTMKNHQNIMKKSRTNRLTNH